MPEQDPFEAYKKARDAKKAAPPPPPAAGAPKPRPKAAVPTPTPRPAVPPPRPKTAKMAKPAPAPAPAKPRIVRHAFDKADLAKMPDDRGFDPGKPAVQRGAFHEDDLAKMAETDDTAPPEGKKARGLVKHRFAKADLSKMADDRGFEPEKPAVVHGAFHQDDVAKMAETEETGPPEGKKVRGLVKHKFARADVAKMTDDRGDVPRPAGFTHGKLGPGVRGADEAPRRRQAGGLLSSGHTRRHAKDLAAEPRAAPKVEAPEGDEPAKG